MLPATVGPAENFAVCCAILRVKFATAMLPVTVLLAWACWEFCGLLRHLVVTACNCHVPCSYFLLQGASQIQKFFTHEHFQLLISLPVSNLTLLSHSKAFKIKSQELGQRQDFCPPLKLSPQLQSGGETYRPTLYMLIRISNVLTNILKFLSLFPKEADRVLSKQIFKHSILISHRCPNWRHNPIVHQNPTLSIMDPISWHTFKIIKMYRWDKRDLKATLWFS